MTNAESSTSHGKFCRDSGTVRRVHPVLDDQSQTGGNVCGLGEHSGSHSRSRQMSEYMESYLSLVHRSSGLFSLKQEKMALNQPFWIPGL